LHGKYDPEEYLDWKMTVEQKFKSHLVPDCYKVRQATSEFKDFAIIWWTSLEVQPLSWEGLKDAMRDRFVTASYKRDLHKKLQRLEQGDMSIQEYFAELQKGMIRCGIVEDTEDKIVHFMMVCDVKFRILLTIKNLILQTSCFSLPCL
jgi:hypothetical protein